MKLKKGDQVQIIKGKDRGKTGVISRVLSEENRIVVEGINLFKKRVRPKRQDQKGETVLLPRPLAIPNAMLLCRNCKETTRVGYRFESDEKVRYCKNCDVTI